jgi:ABC-type molybdate transport system ATPase subunit
VVVGHDPHYDLLDLRLPGGEAAVRIAIRPCGSTLRVKVQARDVSLALTPTAHRAFSTACRCGCANAARQTTRPMCW